MNSESNFGYPKRCWPQTRDYKTLFPPNEKKQGSDMTLFHIALDALVA